MVKTKENIYTDTDIIGYPIKHYIKQIKIFDNETECNRWLRGKEPESIVDIKIQAAPQYRTKIIMVIYMEEE